MLLYILQLNCIAVSGIEGSTWSHWIPSQLSLMTWKVIFKSKKFMSKEGFLTTFCQPWMLLFTILPSLGSNQYQIPSQLSATIQHSWQFQKSKQTPHSASLSPLNCCSLCAAPQQAQCGGCTPSSQRIDLGGVISLAHTEQILHNNITEDRDGWLLLLWHRWADSTQ